MANLHITPTWHKPGFHLHEFDDEGVWVSAKFYPTKEEAEQARQEAVCKKLWPKYGEGEVMELIKAEKDFMDKAEGKEA